MSLSNSAPNISAQATLKIVGSNTNHDTSILRFRCGFPRAFQANTGIVPLLKSRPSPSKSFPNSFSIILHQNRIVCYTESALFRRQITPLFREVCVLKKAVVSVHFMILHNKEMCDLYRSSDVKAIKCRRVQPGSQLDTSAVLTPGEEPN